MAKRPKSSIDWKHEFFEHPRENGTSWFHIEGPGLNDFVTTEDRADAETITAALNLALAARNLKRKAAALADQLTEITTIFED